MSSCSPGKEINRGGQNNCPCSMEVAVDYLSARKDVEKIPDSPDQLVKPDLCHEELDKQTVQPQSSKQKAFQADGPIIAIQSSHVYLLDDPIKGDKVDRLQELEDGDEKIPLDKNVTPPTPAEEIEGKSLSNKQPGNLTGQSEQLQVESLDAAAANFEQACKTYTAVGKGLNALQAAKCGRMDRAVQLWRESSDLGYGKSQFNLAVCYETGQGVQKDISKAIGYYQQATDNHHATAMYNLAMLHLEGVQGLLQDTNKARTLLAAAAGLGMPQAQKYLDMYNAEDGESLTELPEQKAAAPSTDFGQIVAYMNREKNKQKRTLSPLLCEGGDDLGQLEKDDLDQLEKKGFDKPGMTGASGDADKLVGLAECEGEDDLSQLEKDDLDQLEKKGFDKPGMTGAAGDADKLVGLAECDASKAVQRIFSQRKVYEVGSLPYFYYPGANKPGNGVQWRPAGDFSSSKGRHLSVTGD